MSGSSLLAVLCLGAFAVVLTEGSVVSPETFTPEELQAINRIIPKDLNLTQLSLALRADHPHAHLSVVEVIDLYNYKVETHYVTTTDEYILELHRIPGSKKNPSPDGKPVVFLQHGLLCSSMDWVLAGPEKGLAFILADAGYDVWMGNVRGSRYSRNHKYLKVNQKEYWNFEWHDMGIKDLPAMIDHVLEKTSREKVYYIGHSQGSTAFFVMASERPEYNNKIHAMFSLAPVAFCSEMFSPVFQTISKMLEPINLVTKMIGVYEFQPSNTFFRKFTSLVCDDNSILQPICSNVLFLITGFDSDQLDTSLLPAILAHVPAGAGVNQFVHYGQMIKSARFRQLDLGWWGNIIKYGQSSPSEYNLENVIAPVSLHYSVNDWLSDPRDVQKLYSKLPNPIGRFRVAHDKFNHLDYLWAKDVKPLLYDKILSLMKRYKD